VQQAPVEQAPAAQPAFPIRTSHVPLGGGGSNNFTPQITRSRGS